MVNLSPGLQQQEAESRAHSKVPDATVTCSLLSGITLVGVGVPVCGELDWQMCAKGSLSRGHAVPTT